jgi:hypothetical protein
MVDWSGLQLLFIFWAFFFQIILIVHFSFRKWAFESAVRYGWIVYALGILAAGLSILMFLGGMEWFYWISGLIYLVWGIYAFFVEYLFKTEWRQPIYWPVFGPYVLLYLATNMFYWFPLARISKPLWYIYTLLFIASTILNITSHKKTSENTQPS